jgi:hypothetical protein
MIIIKGIKENWDKIEIYIISLWLLFFLIIVLTINVPVYFGVKWEFIGMYKLIKMNIVPLLSIFFLIIGLIFFGRFKYKMEGSQRTAFKITKIQNVNFEHLTFIATYIIPLIAFDLSKTRFVIVLTLILIIIGIIYVKTNIFYANPSLALLGYHIYRVDGTFRTEEREQIIIISRQRLTLGMNVRYKKLDDKIYFVRVE